MSAPLESNGAHPSTIGTQTTFNVEQPIHNLEPKPHRDVRTRTLICLNASAIVERVEEQLLPALYRFVGASFSASPSQLGNLTLARALAQALASPLAGILGHHVDRITVLCIGAAIWGTCTFLFGTIATSIHIGLPLWALNGVGLSFLIPQAQSLVADYNTEEHRGRAFGMLHLTGAVGALLGALFATNIGGLTPFGIEGWRFAFIIAAIASWLIGLGTWFIAADPRYLKEDSPYKVQKAEDVLQHSTWRTTLKDLWEVVSIPTFLIIVLQGIVGTTPWSALVFSTLYLQLIGFSDLTASIILATFLAFNALGGLLGGYVGDFAAQRWPHHGRIVVCQFSVGIGVPLSYILFKCMPLTPTLSAAVLYSAVLAVTGVLITWAATACNNPIFSEIVPPHMRNLIYAFDRSFEGAIAAMGAPLVGILAEKAFGFQGAAEKSEDPLENIQKATSLGNALLIFTAVPWFLCAVFYTGLHFTYPRDKQAAIEKEVWRFDETIIVETQRLTTTTNSSSNYATSHPVGVHNTNSSGGVDVSIYSKQKEEEKSDRNAAVNIPSTIIINERLDGDVEMNNPILRMNKE